MRELSSRRAGLVLLAATAYGAERWTQRTRAMPGEKAAPLPGDELVRTPMWEATRATSIHAPPEEVWPWIGQMGFPTALDHGRIAPSAEPKPAEACRRAISDSGVRHVAPALSLSRPYTGCADAHPARDRGWRWGSGRLSLFAQSSTQVAGR